MRRLRLLGLALCLVAVSVPFLITRFPPITDLPQHAAQVRLFGDAWRQPGAPYAIQWFTPYGLSYAVLALTWLLSGPVHAGRLAFLVVALLWVAAVHLLAAWRRRPVCQAMLASLLLFGHVLYWGFLNFLFGWCLFVWWFVATDDDRPDGEHSTRRLATRGLLAAVVYFAHALWFAFAALFQTLDGWRRRLPLGSQVRRTLALLPVAVMALLWFRSLSGTSYDTGTVWPRGVADKLAPEKLVEYTFGGLRGRGEALLFAFLVLWIGFGLWAERRSLRATVDRRLLLVAGLALGAYLVLPFKFQNTIRFAERWLPIAVASSLLALPPPRLRPRLAALAAGAVLVGFCAWTTAYWVAFDRVEMAGLEEALEALPEDSAVLGLDYLPESRLIRGRPFLQTFAYAQVRQGGRLNFSFADFAPSLVVYQPPREIEWTLGLEWFPLHVRRADFRFFDYVLLHGEEPARRRMIDAVGLVPAGGAGNWWLYRVPRPLPPPATDAPLPAAPPQ